jgi:transposase-like protein
MPEHEVDWSALSDHSLIVALAIELPLSLGAPLDDVAGRFGCSRATVAKWRKELRAELEDAVQDEG